MSVSLAPLVDSDMTAMLTEHLPGVEADVIARIVGRASGFPLYAAEIVRMLTNEGSLVHVDGGWDFHGTAENLAVPDTLQAVIEARLDRLEPDLRSVLQDASVLGLSCTAAGLAAVGNSTNLDADLRQLIQLELLEVEDDPRSPERGQYRFVQGVIQEIAYGRLHRADRRDSHLAAAEYFQTFDDPELAGVVSTHYQKAFDASPQGPQRDELQRRAIEALVSAAERAASLHSDMQAMALYDQAVTLAANDADRAEWLLRAAMSAADEGAFERGIAYLVQAEDGFRAAQNHQGLLRVATQRSYLYNGSFSSPTAVAAIEPAYLGLDDIVDDVTLGVAAEMARGCSLVGRSDEALAVADRALPVANQLERPDVIAELLVTRATALAFGHRSLEAIAGLRGALAVSEEEGLLSTSVRAINNLVSVSAAYSMQTSHDLAPRLLELAERVGISDWVVRSSLIMSETAWGRGAWDEFLGWADRMEELTSDQMWTDILASMRVSVAVYRGVPGTIDQWLAAIDRIDGDDPQTHGNMELFRSMAATIEGNWQGAYDHSLAAALDWAALPINARAAVRLGDASLLDAAEALINDCSQGHAREALHALFAATRQSMLGDLTGASRAFVALLGSFSGIATDLLVIDTKLVFAESVGLDDPAAAQAAQEVADWIEATGTYGLLASSTVLDKPVASADLG